jgi:hypothetical protein
MILLSFLPQEFIFKTYDYYKGHPKFNYNKVILHLQYNFDEKEFENACKKEDKTNSRIPCDIFVNALKSRDKFVYYNEKEKLKQHLEFYLNKLIKTPQFSFLSLKQYLNMKKAIKNYDIEAFYQQYDIKCCCVNGY